MPNGVEILKKTLFFHKIKEVLNLSMQRHKLKMAWNEVKLGTYPRSKFDSELKKYNNRLLALHLIIFIILYGLYIAINILSDQHFITTVSSILIGGFAGYLGTMILYQSKRLTVDAEDTHI